MLYLVRGLPGSGKSYFAAKLCLTTCAEYYEADMYLCDENNEYLWTPSRSIAAHKWCLNTARIQLNRGLDVIIANTFIKRKDLKKYIKLYPENYIVLRCNGKYNNIHGVPEDKLEIKRSEFEDFEGEITDPYKWLKEKEKELKPL